MPQPASAALSDPGRRPRAGVLVLLYLAALLGGAASAWLPLRDHGFGGSAAGPWRASVLAGSADADAYTRARVALGGLLALNRSETMYYLAHHDSAGRPLRSACRYRVRGVPPRARWWSITAYAEDHFLFEVPSRRYSINGETVGLDAEGRFEFLSAPAATAARAGVPWIPTPGDRGLVFALRVYNPDPALAAAPQTLDAPHIEREGGC